MIFIGIDNGLDGGIVVIDKDEQIRGSTVMPTINQDKKEYDIKRIVSTLCLSKFIDSKIMVILEKAQVHPISGKRACFMTGYGYGVIQGILNSLDFPYQVVAPNEWMKNVLNNTKKDKKASIEYCLRKYPNNDWKRTERSTTIHSGLTDACCMAIYGCRLHKGEIKNE